MVLKEGGGKSTPSPFSIRVLKRKIKNNIFYGGCNFLMGKWGDPPQKYKNGKGESYRFSG